MKGENTIMTPNENGVDTVSIKSLFMKEILSRIATRKLKKYVSESCRLILTDFEIIQEDEGISLDTEVHLEMSSNDFKKLLLKKNII